MTTALTILKEFFRLNDGQQNSATVKPATPWSPSCLNLTPGCQDSPTDVASVTSPCFSPVSLH